MIVRTSKPTDQENTDKAYKLLLALIKKHQDEIEPSLWLGAMIGALAENADRSGISFKDFKSCMIEGVNHYKY